jgi:hypothetical protein
LFHVLVVAGAYTHYHAGLVYLRWRDLRGCWFNELRWLVVKYSLLLLYE